MTTYYVAPSGNDNNAGTISVPWRTIGKANNTLFAGDTVIIRAGEYQEIISPTRSGTSGAPITYTAYSGEVAKIVGESLEKPGCCVELGFISKAEYNSAGRMAIGYSASTPKSYIVIDGLYLAYKWATDPSMKYIFEQNESRSSIIRIENHSSVGNVVRNCIIVQEGDVIENFMADFRQSGIGYSGGGLLVENNKISGMWIGIWAYGSCPRNLTVRKNTIFDIGSNAIDIGTAPDGTYQSFQSTLIEENIIGPTHNEDGIQFEPIYGAGKLRKLDPILGLVAYPGNLGVVIRKNIFRYCGENSIDLKGAGDILIEDNIVYGSSGQDDGGLVSGWLPPNYTLYGYQRDRANGIEGIGTGTKWIKRNNESNPSLVNNRSGGKGFVMCGADEAAYRIIIRNNVCYDSWGAIAPQSGPRKQWKVYNNTFVNNNRDYTGTNTSFGAGHNPDGASALVIYGNSSGKKDADGNQLKNSNGTDVMASDPNYGFVFKNNLCVNHNDGEVAFNVYGFSPPATADFDYNVYCNPGTGVRLEDVGGGPAAQTAENNYNRYSFADWKTRCSSRGYEQNSREIAQPGFVKFPTSMRPSGESTLFDFTLTSTSPAKRCGSALTKTRTSGTGTKISVDDARLFCNGYGIVSGDSIIISGVASSVTVINVVDDNTIEVDTSISWTAGASISLVRLGFIPDAGAVMTAALPTYSINLIKNSGFELGMTNWFSFSDSIPETKFDTGIGEDERGTQYTTACIVTIGNSGTNIQLSQNGLNLVAGKKYIVSFKAAVLTTNTPGRSISVSIIKDSTPFTKFGLEQQFNLGPAWNTYTSAEFTSNTTSTEGRLMFWLASYVQPGDVVFIDDVTLIESVTEPGLNAPVITTQTRAMSVAVGQAFTLSVTATGTEPLTYQWQKNGSNIVGAIVSTYSSRAAADDNGAIFMCWVTNIVRSVASDNMVITINTNPGSIVATINIVGAGLVSVNGEKIKGNTAVYSIVIGSTITLQAEASTGWAFAGWSYSGYDRTSPNITIVAWAENIIIRALFTSVTPSPPYIYESPVNQTVTVGQNVNFFVRATSATAMRFQWRQQMGSELTTIAGATSDSFTLNMVTMLNNGLQFSCAVSNETGTTISRTGLLTVTPVVPTPPILINGQPNSLTVVSGRRADFTVYATGTTTLSYQWQKMTPGMSGTNILGETNRTYTILSTSMSDNGSIFQCVISSASTPYPLRSNSCTLTVTAVDPPDPPTNTGKYQYVQTYVSSPWSPPAGIILGYMGVMSSTTKKVLVRYWKPAP